MKRKVKALLALALTLALVSTTLGDNWLYVSAENAAEAEEQTDEPAAAAEEETAASEEAAPEETTPVEEAAPVETASEEKQTEEQKPEAAETPAEQPTEQPAETPAEQPTEAPAEQAADNPAPADDQKQAADNPAPADDQQQPAETPAADTAASAAPAEMPAADAEGKEAEKAPEAEVPGADEKDTETVEEEIGLTEQTIEASVDTEEKDVVITLTGEMPEEATASACPVDISMDGVNIISAYDITIYDADGQEFQPSEEKPLQVKIEDEAVRKALEENTELEVYHLEDAEAEPEQVQEVNLEAAAVEFQAESFSIYVVGTHWTHTYQFLDEDGKAINKQILSAGEKLEEPESPVKDHKKFIGWFDTDGNKFDSFVEEGTLNADATTVLTAKYETVYYVFYKASNKTDSKILYTQTYHNANAPIVVDGVPFAVPSEKALIGWSVNSNATTPDQDLKLSGDDVTLYPVVAVAHWITYDTQGGTILDPTYVLANDTTVAPATNPTKVGYEFAGWFTDAACTADSMFEFGSSLVKDIKLYAKWNPGKANYTVIHWWENADDNEYSYHRSETKNGITGNYTQEVGTDPLDTKVTGKDLFGNIVTENVFTANTINQQVIKGDGSTIVNVYYARKQYTLSFRRGSSEGDVLTTLSKKYGAQISSNEWPKFVYEFTGLFFKDNSHIAQPNDANAFGNWKIASGKYLAYSSTMPLGGGDLWTYNTGSGRSSAQYCLQNLNDNNYTIDHTDYAGSGVKIGLEDAYEITGFTFEKVGVLERDWIWEEYKEKFYTGDDITSNNLNYDGAKFYYKRNSYNVVYHNGGKVEKNSPYKFEADISMAGEFIPKHPAGVESDYTFVGWYQDPEGTTPYNFGGKTMPANDIIVYAKWAAPTYTVTFDLNGATSEDKYSDQTVEKGKLATKPTDPTRDGYTFAGWTKNGSPFSFQTQITENTTLTAQWISKKKYPLTYMSNNGKDVRQADGESYAVGAEAKVINVPEGTAWAAPDGMEKFLCWNTEANGNGTDYYPGDSFRMPENVIEEGAFLHAKWVPKRETTLSYDLNYEGAPAYGTTTIKVPNERYKIGSNSDDPAKIDPFREGYKFLGWSTQKTPAENDKLLRKGEQIQVDTIKEETVNVLYAQWQKLKEVSLNITKIVRGGFGNVNESFNFEYAITGTGVTEKTGTFTLTSGNSKLLENIPEGATVTITETQVNGYTASWKIGTDKETAGSACSYTVTDQAVDGSQIEVTFFNQKDEVAPTGVTTDWLSSILMLLAGLGMAVVMLLTGKRRKI